MDALLFVDDGSGPPSHAAADEARPRRPTDAEALDAYSSVVTTVARELTRSVASLRVARRVRGGRPPVGAGAAGGAPPAASAAGARRWAPAARWSSRRTASC